MAWISLNVLTVSTLTSRTSFPITSGSDVKSRGTGNETVPPCDLTRNIPRVAGASQLARSWRELSPLGRIVRVAWTAMRDCEGASGGALNSNAHPLR